MKVVLIIDDEVETSRALARVLRDRSWHVETVATADAARQFVRTLAPDAIVVDVVGPERPGVDLAAELATCLPNAMVVVTSGFTPRVLQTIGVTIDASRFLPKPYDLGQIDALFGARSPR